MSEQIYKKIPITTYRIIVTFVISVISLVTFATSPGYLVRGIVRDARTDEGLPYVSVAPPGNARGTLTDAKGIFELTVPDTVTSLTFITQGYARKEVPIRKNRVNMYDIRLDPEAVALNEVVVTKRKYSKKNNPAVDLMHRIRNMADANDPEQNDYYNYHKHECITIALNDFQTGESGVLMRRFPFLSEHIDTSEVSGKPILPISMREISSDVHWRRRGPGRREIVTGVKSDGIDEIADQESMRTFLTDVLREINLYDKDINILQNRFVSPLSPLAADFYKFYITDTVAIESDTCVVLSFYPHNKSVFGFVGRMYVAPSDTAMFIRRVSLNLPAEINLNFIESMVIDQEFKRGEDGSRLKTRDDMTLEVKVLPGTPGLYVRRDVAYADFDFDAPADEDNIFAHRTVQIIEKDADARDEVFWEGVRLIQLPAASRKVHALMDGLRRVPLYYWSEKVVKALSVGYIPTGKKSAFDIGPLNTFVSGSTLDGLRLRVGGMTTATLSPHWFSRFYAAYGFRDHKWKYGVELEYSFNSKRVHSREFPIHSIRLNSLYDTDQLGQHYLFTSSDNVFLAWKRMSNDLVTYHRYNALTYTLELENNFSVTATAANDRQMRSRLLGFTLGDGTPIDGFDESWGEVSLRYAPGEKFYQTRSYRFPINLDAPVVTLTHRYAPGGKGWSRWSVNRTELSIMKRFWFSAWGYVDILVSGGHVWSRNTPYTQLFTPNVNLSYTIQPESYALLNPMEFITDSYAGWFVTYWANGAIFNYVPVLKKLKLREVFSCSGYWGNLSDRNHPNASALAFPLADSNSADLRHTPYVEASVGIDNLFRCLRVDYAWRLTHRYPGYAVDRSGLRIALHFTF